MASKTNPKSSSSKGSSSRGSSAGRAGSKSSRKDSSAGRSESGTSRGKRAGAAKSTATRGAGSRGAAKSPASARRTPTKRAAGSAGAAGRAPSPSRSKSQTTIDHEEIRKWAEARGAHPAAVRNTGRGKDDVGMIRLDFPGFSGETSLEEISWEEFFEAFDKNNLALVYQETTAEGKPSNFNKLVSRESA